MAYTITRPNPPVAVTIRIQKAQSGAWVPCRLLSIHSGWVQVDDGEGPLWVMTGHIHPRDWSKLTLFEGLQAERNQPLL